MMEPFELFLERRARNPLRKRELEGQESHLDYIEREKGSLSPEREEQIRKMEELGVEPERIEAFRQAKLADRENELRKEWLKPTVKKDFRHLFNMLGVKVYVGDSFYLDFEKGTPKRRLLEMSIRNLIVNYKDVIPNRKPTIVITDMKNLDYAKDAAVTGQEYTPAGLYRSGVIYIDSDMVDDPDLLVHEYAHMIVDRIPKQTEPLLKREYQNMLDSYFIPKEGKPTRRKSLEGSRNAKLRKNVAKKLKLPTDYATANFDEWFAEIITHWKTMPNNKHSYRFKTMVKKILTRL